MSTHTAPSAPAHYNVKHKQVLSKVAGAGGGSALVMWASALGLSPTLTHAIEVSAPTIAVIVAAGLPYATGAAKYWARYYGNHYLLSRAKKFAESTAAGSEARKKAEATVQKLEVIIADLNDESVGFVNSTWK
jgi:hypothetical protein